MSTLPATDATGTNPPLKMKDLTTLTGVSREAIHFYLREGLLPQPARPKQNVAHYSDEHVVRIKTIKQLQKVRSLPLTTIKVMLQEFDYDALSASDGLANFELSLHSLVSGDLPTHDQDVATIAARTGVPVESIREFHDLGIISIRESDLGSKLHFRDAGIISQWGHLLDSGFADKKGYDANYLKRYADAVKTLAEFEVDNFLAAFGASPSKGAATMAAEGIHIANDLLSRMRTQALMRALRRHVE